MSEGERMNAAGPVEPNLEIREIRENGRERKGETHDPVVHRLAPESRGVSQRGEGGQGLGRQRTGCVLG